MRTITVEPYNPMWPSEFLAIRSYLLKSLKEQVICIEHVGSTAVFGLSSKPIIDIDIVISSYDVFDEVKAILETLGYYHNGDQGIKTREAFKYATTSFMTHHLYVCPQNSVELKKHLLFRDHLNACEVDKKAYANIKIEAAKRHPHDIEAYLKMKGIFINKIYKHLGL
ncbi:GrpB family protein [Liberiplasma polymorphum]|uniref:GrpB family protein n=1 Tax=Liberiplasma polymorphum TaxID=3374570 RepID=UPI003773C4B9